MRIIIPFIIGYVMTGDAWIAWTFNVCAMWCHSLHHTFLVNSASHKPEWGSRYVPLYGLYVILLCFNSY